MPIAAERDGFHGWFVDTRTGSIGSWREGSFPEEGRFASLSAFFQEVADHLEGVRRGHALRTAGGRARDAGPGIDAIRAWARVNGYVVNDRGRVPAAVREAFESSR
ncbi:hypothetical protein EAO71_33540 [Streptomyces sp. ms191]|uniref:Lsr2 family DNA-binding protein n=1 Tax=Streptomyces sp. ms191 TaxID=1827978 RepID=UPI0011CE8889|nr:histone-like nucleoid-structuring protein Lsr2 [Streptomyces sp. ms191]TXS19874.1 hypothetical protein EAO71_33540 [Streptomyces sp. ms191]